jgi:hypothetical protein
VIHAHIDWCLGNPTGAAFHAARASEVAAALPSEGSPDLPAPFRGVYGDFNRAGALVFESFLLALQEDFAGAVEAAAREQQISAKYQAEALNAPAFANYDGLAKLHGTFAQAMEGTRQFSDAAEELEAALTAYEATGAAGTSYNHWTVGRLHHEAGNDTLAFEAAERGLARVAQAGERYFESDLLGLRGQARFNREPDMARQDFEAAMRSATERESIALQLRAARWAAAADPEGGRERLMDVLSTARGRVSDAAFAAAERALASNKYARS